MNVTREVVTDLLPIYFSGEASGDTKVLVEDYFRQDPDFERIARNAATPLETLRTAAPIAASREREKRDLESVRLGIVAAQDVVRREPVPHARPVVALFHPWPYRLSDGSRRPLGSGVSLELCGALWFLYLYFARLGRRAASLVVAISLTLIPIPFVLHAVFAGGSVLEFVIVWITAAFIWLGYFRQRPC